ncbi:MAG: hypothetical protein GQF41_1159 [Candidatus Rifleibacterium amylolyticum]|nr:MAG: hypothetical protein GQF41_1159 [Candidatus Rifleibacterium amylolyticum]
MLSSVYIKKLSTGLLINSQLHVSLILLKGEPECVLMLLPA